MIEHLDQVGGEPELRPVVLEPNRHRDVIVSADDIDLGNRGRREPMAKPLNSGVASLGCFRRIENEDSITEFGKRFGHPVILALPAPVGE